MTARCVPYFFSGRVDAVDAASLEASQAMPQDAQRA
jgi:hypothetical protein